MNELTLVVMAAGIGSRFGGPKQITGVGPSGEFIIDYSVYDAIQAGFTKVIFIIKKEHEEIFKNTIAKRINNHIKVEYAYQDINDVPDGIIVPKERVKPWGTTHAILAAKDKIKGPFSIINADDYYGKDAFKKATKFMKESTDDKEQAVISYKFGTTASEFGSVKRAVIETENNYLTELTESKIEVVNGKGICHPLSGAKEFEIELDHPVSMNFFCFKESFLNLLEQDFEDFISNKENLETGESLVPDSVKKYLDNKTIKVKNIISDGVWSGITYKEDLEKLKETINNFVKDGEYSENLWENM